MRNGIRLSIGLAIFCAVVLGQTGAISSVQISTEPSGARFYVDGQMYQSTQVFLWAQGSKHIVQFPPSLNPDGSTDGCQYSMNGLHRYCLAAWEDSTGTLSPRGASSLAVTASPGVTWIRANLSVEYRIFLRFHSVPGAGGDCSQAPGDSPQDHTPPGLVFVGNQCYASNADLWLPAGDVPLNAFPYPGFVFRGWYGIGSTSDAFLKSYTVRGPGTITADFRPAKRVQFETYPLGMKLLIDRTLTPTGTKPYDTLSPDHAPCTSRMTLPSAPHISIPALCVGEFDFLPGSRHILAAVTPQMDKVGKWWVFDSFSNGVEQNSVYTADSKTSVREIIKANFVPGVKVVVQTSPAGLRVNIDGRENRSGPYLMWAANSKHTVSAPATQVDGNGRLWTFQGWSNNGPASQEVVADENGVGIQLTARYSGMGQLKVETNPPGIKLMLDGEECVTPCSIDREGGTSVSLIAPDAVPLDELTRLDFLGWSDGGRPVRSFTMSGDIDRIWANYGRSYRLLAASDPAGGVDFQFDPPSPDQFYSADSAVTVTALPRSGFKFRRWAGDLAGVYHIGQLTVSAPVSIVAALDRIPYLAPAGVRNAAGDTPDNTVAPGSIISIYGESLAPRTEVGPSNPLAQAIADVVVTVNDRILPLLFVSAQQINAQLIPDLPDGEHTLRVRWTGKPDVTATFSVARNSPGLFSQYGETEERYSLALHEDGTPITVESPARRGEIVTVYGTGFGPVNQPVFAGFAFPESSDFELIDPVEVSLGELTFRPEWSGGAPGFVGILVTRFRVADDLPSGNIDLGVKVQGKLSNVVLLPVE